MSPLDKFSRWLRLKQYQFEVTFCIYIFTYTEKFIIYSMVFLLFSMIFIAMTLYLPRHIAFLIDRAYFYVRGEGLEVDVLEVTKGAVAQALGSGAESVVRGEL